MADGRWAAVGTTKRADHERNDGFECRVIGSDWRGRHTNACWGCPSLLPRVALRLVQVGEDDMQMMLGFDRPMTADQIEAVHILQVRHHGRL